MRPALTRPSAARVDWAGLPGGDGGLVRGITGLGCQLMGKIRCYCLEYYRVGRYLSMVRQNEILHHSHFDCAKSTALEISWRHLGSFGWVYLTAPGRLATLEARPLPGDGGVRGDPWVFGLPMADLVAANPKRNPDSPI